MVSIAFTWALVSAVVGAIYALLSNRRAQGVIAMSIVSFVVAFLFNGIALFWLQPALTGAFWGAGWILISSSISLFISSVIVSLFSAENDSALIWLSGIVTVATALIVWAGTALVWVANSYGSQNAHNWGNQLSVKSADEGTQLPATDPQHLIMVPQSVAHQLGQAKIGKTGLGSIYQVEEDSWTLQSVQGSLWWIAPFEYTGASSQVGFFHQKVDGTPGFIAVSAEDPNLEPLVKLNEQSPIRYTPNGFWTKNLKTHLYLNGYTNGELADPTLEVDDNWKPWYSVSYLKPAFGNASKKIASVLLVDPSTGEIKEFAPEQTPKWVDRILPKDLALSYAAEYGNWGDDRSSAQWPNTNQWQTKPDVNSAQLLYNQTDDSVYLVEMTSTNEKDSSSTSALLINTRNNTAVNYPGFRGIQIGNNVVSAFKNAPGNIQHYDIESLQLYQIEGQPTWVAIYTQKGDHGSGFAAIGILDAKHPSVANVIVAKDKATVLSRYVNYLASGDQNAGNVSRTATLGKKLSGTIRRIAPVAGPDPLYIFVLEGDDRTFVASAQQYPRLPLVQKGDRIELRYLDANTATLNAITFKDSTLDP